MVGRTKQLTTVEEVRASIIIISVMSSRWASI
jgi:hypothetical protein